MAQTPDFVVVNKFPNVDFHSEGAQPGLAVRVSQALGEPLWPVHRLDKMTSGLTLFARSHASAQVFGKLFAERRLTKYYLAIGVGKPKKKQGLIAGDMARSRRKSWKLLASMEQPAVTQFFSESLGEKRRLYLLKPHTGKTHQLRVALKSQGVSIVGDPIYDQAPAAETQAPVRGHLHAYQLHFSAFDEHFSFSAAPAGGLFDLPAVQGLLATAFATPDTLPWPALSARLLS
ncbi:pseudouridine synthase [Simiduia sp. 21SJ11W-1]|uniref:pseudouridine synthase n=1 Tax=Simiduia sp. 21SJ11W-1 TaxID=2909669 RepID=UPI0020A1AF10|nr:pseudouridine synthase [Simiduia sp. 21SJ11W-1]UTA46433.1 pseudouridine synthase [Simiduia sp. 21SJ11W-1]